MTSKYTPMDFYTLLYHSDKKNNLPNNLYLNLFCPKFQQENIKVVWHSNVEKALIEVSTLERDVHMQVALSDKKIPNGKRNNAQFIGEQCISAFPALFCDIDCYKIYNDYIPGTIPDEIRSIVEIDDFKPTAYINSGGGIHAWWFFDKLLLTDTPEKRKELSEVLKSFAAMLRSRVKDNNIKFDSVFDLARVLRVVGSDNYKNSEIRKCDIIEFDPDNLYMYEQFSDMCDVYTLNNAEPEFIAKTKIIIKEKQEKQEKQDRQERQETREPRESQETQKINDPINETQDIRLITLSEKEEEELIDKIEYLCDADEKFSQPYACYGVTRHDPKIDISNILQTLAYRAMMAAESNLIFSDTEIYYIFKYFIAKHGINDEHYSDIKRITRIESFVKPSIKKARKLATEHITLNELKALSEKSRESITSSDLKKIYETIKRLHNFCLVSFTKISDGSYEIVTENGLVSIPNVETLGDQKKLQYRFMDCIKTTFQPVKQDVYRHTLNMMFSIMQTKLSDPEKDLNQQIRSFLIDYILQTNDLDQTVEDLTTPEKSKSNDRWKILLESLSKWLKNIHGVVYNTTLISKALMSIDAERIHARFHGIRRHHWLLPDDLTFEIDMILTERDERMSQIS